MGLSRVVNSTLCYPNNGIDIALAIQNPLRNDSSVVDYSVPNNRLREGLGYIEIVPKSPAEVFGEQVLRPLLDATYDWSLYSLEVLKDGFYRLDSTLMRIPHFLPRAEAQSMTRPCNQLCQEETSSEDKPDLCTVNKVFLNVIENIENKKLGKLPGSQLPQPLLIIPSPSSFQEPTFSGKDCLMKSCINLIKDLKKPTECQNAKIEDAYIHLELAACKGSLAKCHQDLMELIHEIDSNGLSYSIDVLNPLPKLLDDILEYVNEDYDCEDFETLTKAVNKLSRKMLDNLKTTSQREAHSNWIDLMLTSASKEINELVVPSLKMIVDILQRNTKEMVSSEQKQRLCKMVEMIRVNTTSQDEQVIMDEFLQSEPACRHVGYTQYAIGLFVSVTLIVIWYKASKTKITGNQTHDFSDSFSQEGQTFASTMEAEDRITSTVENNQNLLSSDSLSQAYQTLASTMEAEDSELTQEYDPSSEEELDSES